METTMTIEKLNFFQTIRKGKMVVDTYQGAPLASVSRVGDEYVMYGKTGRHALDVYSTDMTRLWAHWQGFVTNNLRAAGYRG